MQRIKDALDRTIAEEQARHKVSTEQKVSAKKSDPGSPSNSDPAVFEAAFKLEDDLDSSSRSGTPKPAAAGEAAKPNADDPSSENKNPAHGQNGDSNKATPMDAPGVPSDHTLLPEIKAKLKKMEKLETTYVGKR